LTKIKYTVVLPGLGPRGLSSKLTYPLRGIVRFKLPSLPLTFERRGETATTEAW